MASRRRQKSDHLIYADAVASRGKSGIWFGEREEFQSLQGRVLGQVKETIDWVPLEGAILAISSQPAGIVVIAPNPSLPGVIVIADASNKSDTAELQERYTEVVRKAVEAVSEPVTA